MAALMAPSLVIAAGNSPLLVVDSLNNRVLLFRPPFRNGKAASLELGQPNFNTALPGAEQNLLGGEPVGAILDKHGAIWVTDESNNRVLRFSPPFQNGKEASLVIGQPDFSSSSPNLSPNGLHVPTYMTFDSSGDLWLSDRDNCRVLEYQPPFTNGINASVVLGEPDLNTANCSASQNGLNQTEGLAFDQEGDLWVADRGNNRILEFSPPFINGMSANLVIGQSNFTSAGSQTTQNGLNYPNGIAFLNGNLWVADTLNHRTLEFEAPLASGMSASVVLGQPDFTTTGCNTTQNGECWAFAVAASPRGDLWLADLGNCRVLEYKPDTRGLFTTDQNASLVLGEPDFTTVACITTRTTTNQPQGVAIGSSP